MNSQDEAIVNSAKAFIGSWYPVLRRLYDVAFSLIGFPEDCDDCGDLEDRPCALHGEPSRHLCAALSAVEDLLGPCVCGHTRVQHQDDDERPCKEGCGCESFSLPPAPLKAKETT